MKCPKCGYNSFESYDVCKKCANDLTGFKQTYGITPIIFPADVRQQMAEELIGSVETDAQQTETAEAGEDMFSFDLPEDQGGAASAANDDPFNFDDDPSPSASPFGDSAPTGNADDDAFANLLETTSQSDADPFADAIPAAAAPPATPKAAEPAASGEFDLENFSWDDTPVASGGAQGATDDFDSLFGDPEEKK